ncbi:MAG: fibronectin type III domain-containing protein [Chitinophagaceae bacterium]|nr:fibronectin type III domain-containing protein [Chitinophagaceae bacterium]
MKLSANPLFWVLFVVFGLLVQQTRAQSIMDPNDSVYTYNSNAAKGSPTNPNLPAVNTLGKWIRTVRLNWNTNMWKAYVYTGPNGVGVPIRLKFPKSYTTANDGKKYPMIVFFHGVGEAGPVTDNEYSMANGGPVFTNAVTSGAFDGFVFIMQSTGSWGPNHNTYITQIINYMVANNKLDPYRVMVNGLSAGGYNSWNFIETYPQYAAAALPMSGVSLVDNSYINTYKFTPIWLFQGGRDGSPDPGTAANVVGNINAAGGNIKYTLYPTLGHGTWNTAWAEPDFFPFCVRAYASNPWTLYGRTQFCPSDTINVRMGVAPGYDAYQWRKDGVIIPGASTDSITVTQLGTYDCQVQRLGIWSDWSHAPVVISTKQPTVTPPITISGLMSKVIPALDNNGVTLKVPSGYASYVWQKVGNNTTVGTDSALYVTTPGDYIAKVTEQYGCSSSFSSPFTVVSANGPNKPDAASGLVASTLSQTSVLLIWSQNPSPVYNETNFEVYRATQAGGPYKLVDITGADVSKDTITGLNGGTKYYFVVRAVNNSGASAASNEANATTVADMQPPTAPANLTIVGSSRSSVTLNWSASTDNVGVTGYYVYVNGGAQSYYVPGGQTVFTVYGLTRNQSYAFSVKATDLAKNLSPASNQVSGVPLLAGFTYNYYVLPSDLQVLPDFGSMTPTLVGATTNISLSPATQSQNYGFLWTGYIIVPTTGTYNFRTTSSAGSNLYLGALNSVASPYSFSGTPIVNNDGTHGSTTVTSANISLTAGVYPIAVAYMQLTGSASIGISWKIPGSNSYVTIPNSALNDAAVNNGSAPAAPSNLVATTLSYNSIKLTWKDNSTNETGFEVWRATSVGGTYVTVGNTAAGVTTFTDNSLSGSTTYYYQVRAINVYGQSAFTRSYVEAEWKFNNNINDSSGNNHTLSTTNSPVFDATTKVEGAASIKLNGTNQNITISNTGSFLQEAYSQRTISCWIKASQTTGTNRMIWDIGGSDNGLALLLNNNTLIAAVASNNSRASISTSFSSTNWTHVAVVYNGDSLLLYVNGSLAASNTSLSFHSLSTTTNGARIGQVNGTNALNVSNSTLFGGWIDDFTILNMALTTAAVNAVMNFTTTGAVSYTTTSSLPAIPGAPSSLVASTNGPSAINLTWINGSGNADNIQLYRSSGNNQSYVLLATLPGTATSYSDNGLFSNATYFYKVSAINAGGASGYSNETSATTADIPPVITKQSDTSLRYGTTTTLTVSATSVNAGTLTFNTINLPSFAQFTDNHDRTGTLVLTPAATDQGSYPGLKIVVADAFGGMDSTVFALNVNNNYAPVIDSIGNYTLSENDTLSIPLSAHEQNPANALSFAVSNVPNNYTIVPGANGQATLQLHPTYAASGTYNVLVTVNDANGLKATRTFTLTVLDKDPTRKIYVRMQASHTIGGVWNSVTGVTSTNFNDASGVNTGLGLNLPPNWWPATYSAGPTTGNNSGVYPDAVLQDYYFFAYYGGPDTVNAVITGMDTTKLYNLTFFASSAWTGAADNGSTNYRVGNQSVTLKVQNNTQNTVTLSSLKPAADGTITFTMKRADAATPVGYLNALVITQLYTDSTAPAPPRQLQAQNVSGAGVQLNWIDAAYNETAYQIFRSVGTGGSYSQIGTLGAGATTYTDSTVSGGVTYYYKVRASNSYGVSAFTDSVSITTADRIPKINPIADVTTSAGQTVTVNVTSVDDATDHVTLTASGLPSFATFVDNGNGTGTVTIQPGAGTNGTYSGITITGTDLSDSSSSTSFNIYIVEPNISSTYVNFTDTTLAPRPWNNMSGIPFAGTVLSNLRDDSNTPTGVSVTLQDGFQGNTQVGTNPNNGTNVYPASVLKSGFFTNGTGISRLLIQGLSATKRYNFVLFNSYSAGSKCLTNFILNGQTLSLDGAYNSNKTVQFNGIAPDITGSVTITVVKATGQDYAMINSLVIQAYDPTVVPLMSPSDLRVIDQTKTSISLQWQDRSSTETGYEIWRAVDGSGNYSLLTTVAAGTTTYTDNSLTSDRTYYYTVRAKQSTTYSAYSNTVKGYTYSSQLWVSFSDGTLTPKPGAPWNVLNTPPQLNMVWNNFANDAGLTTNVGMVQTARWEGEYGGGVNTGNNSGIYPDNVIIQSYGMFAGETSNVTLTGLDLSKTYDFTFFASATGVFDATAYYTVNGSQPVYLNANLNTKGTITLYGVKPNADGTALVTITAYGQAQFALIGAMIVKGYTPSVNGAPTPPVTSGATQLARAVTTAQMGTTNTSNTDDLKDLGAYPNPFGDYFMLSLPANDNDNVLITIMDVSGRPVHQQRLTGLYSGVNQVRVQPAQALTPGVYFVRVIYVNRNEQKTLRVIKN